MKRMALGFETRSCFIRFFFFFFFLLLLLCSALARNPIFFSRTGHETLGVVGRSLRVIELDDYGEPTANHGHDPTWNRVTGGDHHAGRKG
uniref:Protein PSY1 n=1 Tax=Cicer arietinum TaxID=3827 RepID=A0A1S2Y6T1_CICAR|nr:protein PSY1 [Cicer arietinum]